MTSKIGVPAELSVKHGVVMWESLHEDVFDTWWEDTEYGRKHKEHPDNYGKPRWGWIRKKRVLDDDFSDLDPRNHFDECCLHDGTPRVLCRSCHANLFHPFKNGNSHMKRHLFSQECKRRAAIIHPGQQSIKSFASVKVRC